MELSGEEKFNTCRYRSPEKVSIEGTALIGCGSCFKGETHGYFCWKTKMVDVNPGVCKDCVKYMLRTVFGASEE